MKKFSTYYYKNIATICIVAMFFFACNDGYKRVGEEAAPLLFPEGIAENFVMKYSTLEEELRNEEIDSAHVNVVLTSPICVAFTNLNFAHRKFPKGLQVDYFDKDGNKSVVTADYGIVYDITKLIDLQGNVVIESYDGKKLEAPQLYWDQNNDWIFTQEKFTYTNPEDGTIMDGEGMDFNKDLSLLNAHKTYGFMLIKEEDK
ncbi:LPS export ABC transporter periplasmic protein LptC [Aurantibacter crassamenti]|uniref:LPS export ABC transporter periplasmic protein LptC n=1 Tax=Aurantibacter crassamenti TaxID=1837375 RepID=UPI00193A2419|nr:LPS export ABC transporter periplasmic protein LptC [Aurantibacter crassamenti]MBM1104695.1 LPS export ABC transporter periplasmic protein LptC [Aurantibacter crassamenti]